ncbi:MAG TPA: NADH-ubiquinone oxidoreductase-F iron-sulfur binding region domain-containing protein [Acidobacteriota bacterium]|nr:NADH-ubiquinone oxidoreductase-F iron-sulfur binding region domain-containing protein [Acidobacteriota bacterium]
MERPQSIEDFKLMQDRIAKDRDPDIPTIIIPAGTCGQASGANDLIRITKRELLSHQLAEKIQLRITGCHGYCQLEPSVLIEPRGTFYPKVGLSEMARIVIAVADGRVLDELLYQDPVSGRRIELQKDIPFFKSQLRTILARNEKVDPIRIFHYLENDGYLAFVKALESGAPAWIVDEVKASGLRGRGGAGFPTGLKWELLAKQPNQSGKFLVCNADEGDPGAYMDRSVLEGNPHSIIEGMLIGAYATGAADGVIYVRNEYPLAVKHLVIALRQARELGLLGSNILGTTFSFDIRLVKGAGAFVCGEETALIRSIEGKMGEPRQRPPYPVMRGIQGRPTAINNVETWANIPGIIMHGAQEFARIGAPGNSGTKIFSLVGKIRNTGLVEVPMGITIREIVEEIGGGAPGVARIKAVQTGGPSGGCIPSSLFDLPIDYESLSKAGSIMGSGGMIVMDENTCMVDVARYFMSFLKDESCGKCFTCRKGTQRMFEILDDIAKGKGTLEQLSLLEELALVVKDTTMCGLGQSAPNPILSTLRYFREEYERHIVQKKCDASVCRELVGAPCQSACPLGTEAWRYVAHLARGEQEEAYRVIRETNPFPSVCARVCDHRCEDRCRLGATGARPVAIRALKRFVTDNVDPSTYKPIRAVAATDASRVAVIGSGPAGLTAAHYLSIQGFRIEVFEVDPEPGGMLISGIPSYRLRRDVLRREIDALLDENITLHCGKALGRDVTLDGLFAAGFKAVFLALGAHKSRRLDIEGEDLEGVYPAIQFLKAFNLRGDRLAMGRVAVIGGGNSAIDAARVALRQEDVRSVTVLYRRTRQEMPALKEEIQSALAEGISLEALVAPIRIQSAGGRLTGIECIRNRPGDIDASGRRRPVPVPGTEFNLAADTLIVTIGDEPDLDYVAGMGLEISGKATLRVDAESLATNLPGVFAGGDVVTGPDTVVNAIAAGKRAAVMIGRYLRGEEMKRPPVVQLPRAYVEPCQSTAEESRQIRRAEPPTLPISVRVRSFSEVELALPAQDAAAEARRCLRCDLEFTKPGQKADSVAAGV